jgi:hypothetical protein
MHPVQVPFRLYQNAVKQIEPNNDKGNKQKINTKALLRDWTVVLSRVRACEVEDKVRR